MIRLRLDPQPLENIPCDVAIVAFGEDDLPLNGPAGRIDACLGGESGRLIAEGHLKGAWKSQALFTSRGRVASELVLFAGMGSLRDLSARDLSTRIDEVIQRAVKLSARSMATYVPSAGGPRTEYGTLAAETVNGALRGLADCTYDVDFIFCEPEPERYGELVEAAERIVFRRVKGREVSVEVIV